MTSKKVLVVEDDGDSASVLEAYLLKEGFDVAIAADGSRAVQLHAQWKPDLVLLDMMLPSLSGIEVLAEIRRVGNTPVIMVTAIGDEPEKLGALRYGADDYVVKPYSPKEVVARVFAVLRRSTSTRSCDDVLIYERLRVDPTSFAAHTTSPDGTLVPLDLTRTEFILLMTLLRTPSKAFTRSELLEACLPDSDALERVLDTHVLNLRRKLDQRGITSVLVTVRSVGYRFR
ncbi:response regulator [Xanthomonas citri pv. citri]|uniref:response regulator n=1 Tax=Xanthomonas citri TaxID=346 RepID=UPI00174DE6F3|nr:response regulator [Xanthomonas citri]MBD4858749.1 response regulator [Xanthomonas citri pv. citri]QYF33889.1 response regulator transcription factor [Xanthomonas citri pv. citri]